ncbi:hypothetical protein C8F04DRAFT_687031 [Mycena alexandri]|uniref:methylisocitrate lyase n=1 Tax=Mycena alexandri TaxID=1745969 RepID=A0AAD6XD65_9AGAR|nr:hypothetical protein C8F04DRAFT_687031 [Mycena alexandri]
MQSDSVVASRTSSWQFITVRAGLYFTGDANPCGAFYLGGLHSNAYISGLFAKEFAKTGMTAYVELVQRYWWSVVDIGHGCGSHGVAV